MLFGSVMQLYEIKDNTVNSEFSEDLEDKVGSRICVAIYFLAVVVDAVTEYERGCIVE